MCSGLIIAGKIAGRIGKKENESEIYLCGHRTQTTCEDTIPMFYDNAKLFFNASPTFFMESFESVANFMVESLFLSIVLICDKFTIESFFSPSFLYTATHIG